MIDTSTQKPLRVSTEAPERPYIRLPYDQVDELRSLLDRHGVRYRVEENISSLNGGPWIAYVNLGRGVVAEDVQAILDTNR